MEKNDKIAGSLLGLAYGDVLGCPVETWSEDEILKVYGHMRTFPKTYNYTKIGQMDSRKVSRLRPLGLHSDDTQQALALLNVCLSKGGWTKSKWADILVAGDKQNSWRGTGPRFREAVKSMSSALAKKESPEDQGSKSAGIGAAMRTSVLGGVFHKNFDQMKTVALESSIMTHADIRAIIIAYAVAYISYAYVNGKTPAEITSTLVDHIAAMERHVCERYLPDLHNVYAVSQGIQYILRQNFTSLPNVRASVRDYAKNLLPAKHALHPNDGFALLGGLHAVGISLLDKVDPAEALFDIIRLGDDTDTVAAIVGGLFGARFGTGWMDTSILTDYKKLERYVQGMQNSTPVETQFDFLRHERKLTESEEAFRKKNAR